MNLQIFIEDEDLKGSFRNFPIDETKIIGWFNADAETVDDKIHVCINLLLPGGLYSVKFTTELREYLKEKFGY